MTVSLVQGWRDSSRVVAHSEAVTRPVEYVAIRCAARAGPTDTVGMRIRPASLFVLVSVIWARWRVQLVWSRHGSRRILPFGRAAARYHIVVGYFVCRAATH